MVVNFFEIEDAHQRLPEEWREKFSEVDWSENLFVTYDVSELSYESYEITTDDEVFGRFEDGSLKKLGEFTSKLELSTGIILEEEDYELELTAYFFKGALMDFKFIKASFIDREKRIKYQNEFNETVEKIKQSTEKEERKSKSIFYRIWKNLISIPLTVIRYVLGFLIKVCFFIEDLLT